MVVRGRRTYRGVLHHLGAPNGTDVRIGDGLTAGEIVANEDVAELADGLRIGG